MKYRLGRMEGNVLLIIGFALLAVWLLGLGSSMTWGGFINLAPLVGFLLVFVVLVAKYRTHRQ